MFLLLRKDPEDWEIDDVKVLAFRDRPAAEAKEMEIRSLSTPHWTNWETRILEIDADPAAEEVTVAIGWPYGEPFLPMITAGPAESIANGETEWMEVTVSVECPLPSPTDDGEDPAP